MPKSVEAIANPALLGWARKTAGYDRATAARKLGQDEDVLRAWESGERRMTVAQLRRLAELYRRPLAAFYLAEPPTSFSVLRDFRRLPRGTQRAYSPELLYLIRRVIGRQEWAVEYRTRHGSPPLEFVGSETIQSNVVEAAQRVRTLLGLSIQDQQSWRDPDGALLRWIGRCERIGLLVFQSSDVSIDEMRGFAIPHRLASAVLVNSKDTRAGRIFTLFHEYGHIAINAAGVSNLRVAREPQTERQKIEVFCNCLAAEILVPRDALLTDLRTGWQGDPESTIYAMHRRYSVSREVIARRLLDLAYIGQDEYAARRNQYALEAKMSRMRQRNQGPPKIPFSRIVVRDNGRQFTREVLAAYGEGEITTRDVSTLLNARLGHLSGIELAVSPARWQGAEE